MIKWSRIEIAESRVMGLVYLNSLTFELLAFKILISSRLSIRPFSLDLSLLVQEIIEPMQSIERITVS
jgi:hypothetical protein